MDWGQDFLNGPGLWEVLLLVPIILSYLGLVWAAYLIGRIERRIEKSFPQDSVERIIDHRKHKNAKQGYHQENEGP